MKTATNENQKWAAQLAALSFLRKRRGAHMNAPVGLLLFGLLACIVGVVRFGFDNTVFGMILMTAVFILIRGRGSILFRSKWSKDQRHFSDDAVRMEERLLRSFVQSSSSILRFRMSAPELGLLIASFNLLPEKPDYVHHERSLVGASDGTAFCAVFVEAGVHELMRDAEGLTQKRERPVFRGLCLVVDCAEMPADILFPGLDAQSQMRDQVLMVLVPMNANPFVIRDNPGLWPSELSRLHETSLLISNLVRSISTRTLAEVG